METQLEEKCSEIMDIYGRTRSKVFEMMPLGITEIFLLTLESSCAPKFDKKFLRDKFREVIHLSDVQKFERAFKNFAKNLFSFGVKEVSRHTIMQCLR